MPRSASLRISCCRSSTAIGSTPLKGSSSRISFGSVTSARAISSLRRSPPEQVRAASEAFRTYDNMQDAEDKFYLVEHTAFTYLVFPESGFVDFFRREATPQQIAERVACFAEAV